MTGHIRQAIQRHKGGESVGIYSVCSAHPLVIEAACRQALADESFALVEATSNQVDQFGGYTGMTPADFRDFVYKVAEQVGLSRDRVVLGGDHLGPNRWRERSSGEAMSHAERLIEGYVAAGFSKIHLDCSMACADDRVPLTDEVVATRAARLAAAAERIAVREFGNSRLLYVVGTEVPVPGGAQETLIALSPTEPAAARATIAAHRVAFDDAGIPAAWSRVVGLVAQPGVEFDHHQVIDYRHDPASNLSQVVGGDSNLVFEAHSTDYQTRENLAALVSDHFAILKVGPGLTFALREALFSLEAIERELIDRSLCSNLTDVIEERMRQRPEFWQDYYQGTTEDQRLSRRYSFSDRVRYYWPDPQIRAAVSLLCSNLDGAGLPLPLLSQHLPDQYRRVREGGLVAESEPLILDRIGDVLRDYSAACGLSR